MPCHSFPCVSVGLKEIDDEHRELFRWFDMLDRSMRSRDRMETERVFDFLAQFLVAHFDAEDRLMLEAGDPNRRRHKAAHDQYLAEFLALKSHYKKAGSISPARFQSSGWLDALQVHISEEDASMARHVARERKGVAIAAGQKVPNFADGC